jgi:hypothetical protein
MSPELNKFLGDKSIELPSRMEMRIMIRAYHRVQQLRVRLNNSNKAYERSGSIKHQESMTWVVKQLMMLESQIKKMCERYVDTHPMGWFAQQTHGMGPLLAATLFAFVDIEKTKSVSSLWAFAGLGKSVKMIKGERITWSPDVKRALCRSGDFLRLRKDQYGDLYRKRRLYEWEKNFRGEYAEQADMRIAIAKEGSPTYLFLSGKIDPEKVRKSIVGGTAIAAANCLATRGRVGVKMLSPSHINQRAIRYTLKILLSHLYACWYEQEYGKPPKMPYAVTELGKDYIAPYQKRVDSSS